MVPLAPKLKVITYHFISYRRKSVFNLVEIQNTFVVERLLATKVVYYEGIPRYSEFHNGEPLFSYNNSITINDNPLTYFRKNISDTIYD